VALSYFDNHVGHNVAQLHARDFPFQLIAGRYRHVLRMPRFPAPERLL